MKKPLLVCTLAVLFINAYAQEMWGISNSNYSGNMGIALNPSTIVGAPYQYDMNIFALDIFLENNLVWLPASDRMLHRAIYGSPDAPAVVIDSAGNDKKSAFIHVEVLGPSFAYCIDKKSSIGFHTAFRTEAGILKVPYGLDDFGVETAGAPAGTGHIYNVPRFSAAMMSWAEAGITYGRVAVNETDKYIKWAATLNYLIPLDGMFVDMKSLSYKSTDSVTSVQNIDATIAHDVSNDGQDIFANRGYGLGSTIGITIMKGRSDRAYSLKTAADEIQKYKYRFGVSLMDVGFVRFNSGGADVVDLSKTGGTSVSNINDLPFGSFPQFDTTLVNRIGGKVSNQAFNIWLPTALSAQFDYALSPHWYANITALNRVHFEPNQIARGNQDVLSLRYERRNFEIAANLNLFEYSSLSSGVCLRYKWFIIGSDRLSQIVSIGNLNSMDLYFGFKINFTSLPPRNVHSNSCPAYKAN